MHPEIINQIFSYFEGYKRAELRCGVSLKLQQHLKYIQVNELMYNFIYTEDKISYLVYPDVHYPSIQSFVGWPIKIVDDDEIRYEWFKNDLPN